MPHFGRVLSCAVYRGIEIGRGGGEGLEDSVEYRDYRIGFSADT